MDWWHQPVIKYTIKEWWRQKLPIVNSCASLRMTIAMSCSRYYFCCSVHPNIFVNKFCSITYAKQFYVWSIYILWIPELIKENDLNLASIMVEFLGLWAWIFKCIFQHGFLFWFTSHIQQISLICPITSSLFWMCCVKHRLVSLCKEFECCSWFIVG